MNEFKVLEQKGITFVGAKGWVEDGWKSDFSYASDAAPALITASNAGIPAFLTAVIDPKWIDVLLTPMVSVDIIGSERKMGDWTTKNLMFPIIERTGTMAAYDDRASDGIANVNVNWVTRDTYSAQTGITYGERELDIAGLAKIDLVSRLNESALLQVNKFNNQVNFFGLANTNIRGLLNDPALPAYISPSMAWTAAGATGDVVYEDIRRLFVRLQTQLKGVAAAPNANNGAKMTLSMSHVAHGALLKTYQFNVNVIDQLKKNFPNMTIKTAPEYQLPAGEMVQLKLDEVEGQLTTEAIFCEKLRSHNPVVGLSSWNRKMSTHTAGCVIYQPLAIASMMGV